MIKTLIKQGEKICQQSNDIKQLKEENRLLRNANDDKTEATRKCKKALDDIMYIVNASDEIESWNNDESFKKQHRNKLKNKIREIAKKELDNIATVI